MNNPRVKGTNTAGALSMMFDDMFTVARGDRVGVPNVAVVVSDGRSNVNAGATVSEAERVRDGDVTLVTVGLGSEMDRGEIDDMASNPDSQYAFYLTSSQQDDMQAVADQVLDTLCQI